MMSNNTPKKYDIILFGVTGFTGKLAVEYLLQKKTMNWAACARDARKAQSVLDEIAAAVESKSPPLLTADLVCETDQQHETLRAIVSQTQVVLTCAGPFEKYGTALVKHCAELGVSYADITGETDFVRQMIQLYDTTARESGAAILCHCGNDCIPQSLSVFELNRKAIEMGGTLKQVRSYVEVSASASFSGGTAATAAFQLSKERNSASKPTFDPLLQTADGSESEFKTKNISPKTVITVPELEGQTAGPWIMAPVMVNAVRRANALLNYSRDLEYGDAMISRPHSVKSWLKEKSFFLAMSAAVTIPSLSWLLPQPGDGPDREEMENGFFTLHTFATIVLADGSSKQLKCRFHFNKDVGYLYTAALLVETGILLLEKVNAKSLCSVGVITPEVALGHDLLSRILGNLDSEFEIEEVVNEK